jgi:hypothetical protein
MRFNDREYFVREISDGALFTYLTRTLIPYFVARKKRCHRDAQSRAAACKRRNYWRRIADKSGFDKYIQKSPRVLRSDERILK